MKYTISHTHLNKAKGRDEPIFIVVPGPKETCPTCQKPKGKK